MAPSWVYQHRLPWPKMRLICRPDIEDISGIKLIRTDTTHDLSQKAEKRWHTTACDSRATVLTLSLQDRTLGRVLRGGLHSLLIWSTVGAFQHCFNSSEHRDLCHGPLLLACVCVCVCVCTYIYSIYIYNAFLL